MAGHQPTRSIGALEEEIKRRDERIDELRHEIDQLRDLVRRMEENVDDADNVIEAWKETFDMVETESGTWTNGPFWDKHNALVGRFNDLVRRWNKYLPVINGRTQPVGRPLAASEAQVAQVRKLRKAGRSLRWIADEMSLGVNTVRTIVAKDNGSDRTTRKHREHVEIDRAQATRWKRQKRTGDALPKRAQRVVEEGRALIKEAKGLGR
jgi:FtsZ-binding cell division protein ZapB